MSYEGYDRFLCSNGHLWELDAHVIMYDEELQKCPICKEKEVWSESIDETYGERKPTQLVLDYNKTKVCEHCETVLQAIYINPHDVRQKNSGCKNCMILHSPQNCPTKDALQKDSEVKSC